jgi:hypothetical protein
VPVTVVAGPCPRRVLAEASPCRMRRKMKEPNATSPPRTAHQRIPLRFPTEFTYPAGRQSITECGYFFVILPVGSESLESGHSLGQLRGNSGRPDASGFLG